MASFTLDGVQWDRVKVLGKGSFGEAILVRKAGTSGENQQLAVCKRVVLSNMKPEERREAVNEVNVLKRLRHANIVEYYGSYEVDDTLHIFMEYANSGDVEGLIKSQRSAGNDLFDEVLIASIVLQMASAVKYLHERRILHRDLKAQNVFLSRRRPGGPLVVKLGDFGISTVLRNTHALAKTVCGTPYYFSPELCLNKPYNAKTDIWSLGCIVYEMATLRHAFDAQNMKALVARILKGNYTPISSKYSVDLTRLIDQMLQQKSDRRLDIDGVLHSSWMRRHAASLAENDLMRTITANIRAPTSQIPSAAPPPAPGTNAVGGGVVVPTPAPKGSPTEALKRVDSAGRRAPAGSNAVAAAGAVAGVNVRPAAPFAGAAVVVPGNLAAAGPRRHLMAAERREALDKLEADRRRALDEKRRQRNVRVDQQKLQEARKHQIENLDEIRKRMELQSYEEQQVYVEKGWEELQRVSEAQDARERQAKQREQHLEMLKQQMNAIESKMQARRAERDQKQPPNGPSSPPRPDSSAGYAPAVGGLDTVHRPPAGFTPASWALHEQKMRLEQQQLQHKRQQLQRQQHQQRQQDAEPQPDYCYRYGEPMRPPPPSNDDEDDDDDDYHRRRQQAKAAPPMPPQNDVVMALWEEEKRRIEAARAAEAVRPGAADLAWQKQQALLNEAREAERRRQEQAAAAAAAAVPPQADDDHEFDDVMAFVHQVQHMGPEGDQGGDANRDEDEQEDFEEPALPANEVSRLSNVVKFTLDGKTLHLRGASPTDPLTHRVEALRVFLTDALGGDKAFEDLHASLEFIQNCDADDDEADRMLAELERAYGPHAKFVDLMVQYMVCVNMMAA